MITHTQGRTDNATWILRQSRTCRSTADKVFFSENGAFLLTTVIYHDFTTAARNHLVRRMLKLIPRLDDEASSWIKEIGKRRLTVYAPSNLKRDKWHCDWFTNCAAYRPLSKRAFGNAFQSYEFHLPYGITQCYLPPDTSERAPP